MNTLLPLDLALRIMHIISLFIGISIEKSGNGKVSQILRKLWSGVLFFGMITASILSLRFWITTFSMTTEKLTGLFVSTGFFIGSYSYATLVFWHYNDEIRKHRDRITEITHQKGVCHYKRRFFVFTLFIAVVTILISFGFTLELTLYFATSLLQSHIFNSFKLLFFNQIASYFAIIIYFSSIFSLSLCCNSFVIVCLADKLEFKYLNDELSIEPNLSVEIIMNYFNSHSKMVAAVAQANNMFSYFVFFILSAAIPTLVLLLYAIWTSLTPNEVMWVWPLAIVMLLIVLLLTVLPASLNNEVIIMYACLTNRNKQAYTNYIRLYSQLLRADRMNNIKIYLRWSEQQKLFTIK